MVVLASCIKYLIHGWSWLGPPGAANTLQRPPLRHLLRKYGTHCSLNQTFNFGISNRHQSPSAGNVLQALWLLRITKEIEKFQEAVIIRTVNTVVLCCIVGDIKPACLPPLRTWNSTSTSSEVFNWILQRNSSSSGPVQD